MSIFNNKQWEQTTKAQKESVRLLIKILLDFYNITKENIYEHDKIAYKTAGEGANLYDYSK